MSTEIRAIAKAELDKLTRKVRTLRAQAQGQRTVIEIKNLGGIGDPLKVDTAAILQAAKDLHDIVTEAAEAQKEADQLTESLYG